MTALNRQLFQRLFFVSALVTVSAGVIFTHDDYSACIECYMLDPYARLRPWMNPSYLAPISSNISTGQHRAISVKSLARFRDGQL